MGVEVEESNLPIVSGEEEAAAAAAVPAGDESSLSIENGNVDGDKQPITFGTHGEDEPVVKEEIVKPSSEVSKFPTDVADEWPAEVSNFPKNAVDEWPAPPQIHPHFVQKYRQFEDPKIKAKLEQADLELTKKNQDRAQLIEKKRKLQGDRQQKIGLLKALNEEKQKFYSLLDEKKKERDPLKEALGALGGRGERGICSSEEELNRCLKSMQYHMQHETISLDEEKQLMKDMKKLEATRPMVIANAAKRAGILESMGEKNVLDDQMKLLKKDMDGVHKDKQTVLANIKQLQDEKEVIDKKIAALDADLDALSENRDKTYQRIVELRKQRDEGNSAYFQNRSLLNSIKGLANKKDIAGVKEKAHTEFENWFSQWKDNKSFREDYEKRVVSGLDNRQISRDGRMRNFDEKLIFAVEKVTPPETVAASRTLPKQAPPPKDDVAAPAPAPAPTPAAAVVEQEKSGKAQKEATKANKTAAKAVDEADDDEPDFYVPEKKQKDLPKATEVDEAKLKEIRREEEIAKAKQALERKKKKAAKAAAKAALHAQKEAEKKQKALEKKEKKKAGVSDEPKEAEAAAAEEVPESDKSAAEEAVEPTVASKKANNNPMKRRVRPRGPDSLPKTLLKRKKATNYWMWAVPAGAAMTVLAAAVAYYYLN